MCGTQEVAYLKEALSVAVVQYSGKVVDDNFLLHSAQGGYFIEQNV